ncbi:MAG: hypothetical protein JM58_15130 [Peptococcaceae bacterium BICA1-8]|nr:MAG: hypothetical protein JM58_15130 [Peptococcaceae bacterium BICA1-8]
MHESAKNIEKNPHEGKKTIDVDILIEMEGYGKKLGVSSIAYTKVNPNFIFKDFEILYDNAVIFTMEMNKELIATNPSIECSKEIFRTYAGLGVQ